MNREFPKGENAMTNREWEAFGEEIRRTVQNAVDSKNYEQLNQTITSTINQAVSSFAGGVRSFQNAMEQKQRREQLFAPRAASKAGSILLMIFGYLMGGIGLLLSVCLACFVGIPRILTGTGILMTGFLAMAVFGTCKYGKSKRFVKYLSILNEREFCNLKELEDGVGKSHKFVVKDLQSMIRNGWFCQGHLDKQNTCLIVSNEMYKNYLRLEEQRHTFETEEQEKEQRFTPEVRKVLEEGDAYVKKIRACNDAIPGEEISTKILKMEIIVDKIFDRIEQEPALVDDVRKLMDYYLPTTIKLLEAYQEMDAQPVGGENIQTAKQEIEGTIDTLNIAFEKILDGLFQKAAWDVSSDISVLNTMLAQEGLRNDGLFHKVK